MAIFLYFGDFACQDTCLTSGRQSVDTVSSQRFRAAIDLAGEDIKMQQSGSILPYNVKCTGRSCQKSSEAYA